MAGAGVSVTTSVAAGASVWGAGALSAFSAAPQPVSTRAAPMTAQHHSISFFITGHLPFVTV